MSQNSERIASRSGMLTLRLKKLSYAVESSVSSGPVPYNYLLQDVSVIFDDFGTNRDRPRHSMMRIAQGAEVKTLPSNTLQLEVDLFEVAKHSLDAAERARRHHMPLRTDQLPGHAIYKRQAFIIALKHPISQTHSRKMQMKFGTVDDFDIAFSILRDLDFPLSDHQKLGLATPNPDPGPQGSLTPRMGPNQMQHLPRPPGDPFAHNIYVQQHDAARLSGGSPSSRALAPSNSLHQEITGAQYGHHGLQRALTASQTQPHQYRHLQPSLLAVPESSVSQPSFHFNDAQVLHIPSQQAGSDHTRASSAIFPGSHAISSTLHSDPVRPSTCMPTVSSDLLPLSHPNTESRHDQPPDGPNGNGSAPGALPMSYHALSSGPYQSRDNLSSMIPPRRELPFGRTGSSASTCGASKRPFSSHGDCFPRPSSSSTELPPLPLPTFAEGETLDTIVSKKPKTATKRPPSSKWGWSKEKTATAPDPPAARRTPRSTAAKRASRPSLTKETPTSFNQPRKPTRQQHPQVEAFQDAILASTGEKVLDPALATAAITVQSSETSVDEPRHSSYFPPPTSTPHAPRGSLSSEKIIPTVTSSTTVRRVQGRNDPKKTAPTISTPTPQDLHSSQLPHIATTENVYDTESATEPLKAALDRIASHLPVTAADADKENQAITTYASMSYEERMATLEDMIVGFVGDDKFLTLCEDVERCWQRVGLGM